MKKIVIIVIALSFISSSVLAESQSGQVKGKNWDIRLSGEPFYDDNVIQSPEKSRNKPTGLGDQNDWGFDISGQGRYKFEVSDSLTLAADYSLYYTDYFDLSRYDQLTHTFGTGASYFIPNTGNKIWSLNLRYFYQYNNIDEDSYNGVNYISPSTIFMINPKIGFTHINYTFTNENNWENSFRKTNSHSIGIEHYYFILGNRNNRLRVGYAYRNDDAKRGLNDLDSHKVNVELNTLLNWGIILNAGYRYESEDYDNRPVLIGTGTRDDDRHDFSVEVSKVLLKDNGFLDKLTGSLKYKHVNHNSTDKLHEYNRNVVSLFLEVRF